MRRILSLGISLLLAAGLLGLGFSACRDLRIGETEFRAASCEGDEFCRQMCRLNHQDCPGVIRIKSADSDDASVFLPVQASLSTEILFSPLSFLDAAPNRDPAPPNEAFLWNCAFLI